ncbi:MAG TPA: PDZ domain-containing protein [Allosphingosinicella sp.]|jgi:S1-C subfamily serine protease
MNKLKLAVIFAAGAALALSPAHVAAQETAKPISLGIKLEHVTEGLGEGVAEGGQVTAMLPDRTGAALGLKVGDILIEAGGTPISGEVFRAYMKDKKAGDELVFKVKRGDAMIEVKGKGLAAPEGSSAPAAQPQG